MKYYNFKPFEKVLVRDNDDKKWGLNMFSHYDETATQYPFMCLAGCFTHCIPYEGNEHLLGTTNAPQPKRWRAEVGDGYYSIGYTMKPVYTAECGLGYNDKQYEIGNYFQTKQEAQAMVDKITAMLKGE